jgi:hypothetical protein
VSALMLPAHYGLKSGMRRNVSPPRQFFFVAVLMREYHNLHRRVTARAQVLWSAPTDLGGVAISSGPSAVADGQHRIDVLYRGPMVTCGRTGGMVVSGGARRLT